MFRLIRYTIYLVVLLLCMFLLQEWGVDVKGGFKKGADRVQNFIQGAEKEITASSTGPTTGVVASTTVKSYTSTSTSKNKQPTQTGMSIAGVLKYTNIERVKAGLKPLVLNKKLSNSAVAKVEDMFALQYFEHDSPAGKTAADLVREQGYVYQSVGENLALGDFGTDQKLVEAWMNSPLHRKNILNPKFSELGLAVARGTFKGDMQWLAVQHFGKPAPVCVAVPTTLKEDVDAEKVALEAEEQQLQSIANEIESDPEQNKSKEFIEEYNARVASYNARLGNLRDLIKEYNAKVEAYNQCASA
ncbi:MAG: CAP domain-containing protein [Patescibacteria group bacterium]